MRLSTRKLLDRAFSGMGIMAIVIMAAAVLIILCPIFTKGLGALVFKATIEHRRLMIEQFDRGDKQALELECETVNKVRQPVYDMVKLYEQQASVSLCAAIPILKDIAEHDDNRGKRIKRKLKRCDKAVGLDDKRKAIERTLRAVEASGYIDEVQAEYAHVREILDVASSQNEMFREVDNALHELLGPFPQEQNPVLVRKQYGQTRWDRAQVKLRDVLYAETWDYSDSTGMGKKIMTPRIDSFKGTALEPLFDYVEKNAEAMLNPRTTFYAGFFFDSPKDSHIFGGILPELLGTLYLTIGAMLFALPVGVIAAIFFTEYAGPSNIIVNLLRTCVSTLAGVPSIVFGLFGLAFFINAIHLPKSVFAGALTLALLILPTIIRASEEAIRSVPHAYREAALALGAGKWHTIVTVILPAALPGILTGSVISMGRAAGETAPIIFTAAVSVGKVLTPVSALFEPTPVLSWNIYNLCTEHEAVDEIRHVQFGMVASLILLVLLLNSIAIIMRARISKKLKG